MTSIISISKLNKSYKNNHILKSLNWDIDKGDVVALLGKNGAGKSTLLESIMGLRDIDNGELRLWRSSWLDLKQKQREKVAFVSQDTVGFEWMRVKDFLAYLGNFFIGFDRQYCNELQQRWNLEPKQKVADLSRGQTQILHIIQALSVKPELLILDEPVAHLDPNMRRQFISELKELTSKLNTTVIFSSHIVSDLERVANKVALLKNGKIEHFYEVAELKASIAQVKILSEGLLKQSGVFSEFINWNSQENIATATIVKPLTNTIDEIENINKCRIEIRSLSLEDWYLEISNDTN